mgnify:FL=1
MSSLGYKSEDPEINKLITRLNKILSELENRLDNLEEKVG